jgi:[ribosomal protein S5]-alanine N-acetyltransferase
VNRVFIRKPSKADCEEYLELFRKNELAPFVYPPSTKNEFLTYLKNINKKENKIGLFVCLAETGKIIGVINFNEIVRGNLQSAYLGYYISREFEGNGYMFEGLKLAITFAFSELRLHRLEANIQLENIRSINLVKRLGFKKEGLSPKYLRIKNTWKDHERWAILKKGQKK